MQTYETITKLRAELARVRNQQRIALVPTMGNLHAGHLSLVQKAHALCDRVVVSIYVNPLQFGEGEDFANYPRTLEADCKKLEQAGADWVFTPNDQELYPLGKDKITTINVPGLDNILEGESRPDHFRGVATVVNKFFNIVQPDVAIFGEKDFQQLLVIRRMVEDLNLPVEVVGMPTLREPDGLAMSSRNGYLSDVEREQASQIFSVLNEIREAILAGSTDYAELAAQASARLQSCGFLPDYVEIRRREDLQFPKDPDDEKVILVAARLGKTRLIDNLRI